jgi:formylglycine-generating enzyme required for sulfatase activity
LQLKSSVMKKEILSALLLCCLGFFAKANNVSITSVSVSGTTVSFNLSWDNSWNSTSNIDTLYPRNWDAVWVFVKVQSNATNLWQHQLLSTTASAHTVTSSVPLTIETTTDGVGVFIRRTNSGSGNISGASVTLQMQTLPTGTLNFKVFGVEMVKIPSGSFNLGDGVTSSGAEPRFFDSTITATTQANGLLAGKVYSGSPAIPSTFPMGTDSMYAMKYEITYEQYADFLNTLTYNQQANHMDVAPNSAAGTVIFSATTGYGTHNYLRIQDTGTNNTNPAVIGCDYNNDNVFNDLPDGLTVACANLDYKDFLAYLDWAGLRPMTEMEFEKICRGTRYNGNPVERVAHEYAWGTTNLANYATTSSGMVDVNKPTMYFSGTPVNGRILGSGGSIPGRVGLFAEAATGREAAGAGFYGNMEMSGNVHETVVPVTAAATGFTAQVGDGILDVNAEANQSTWPTYNTTNAYGYRGSVFSATSLSYNSSLPVFYTRMPKISHRGNCPKAVSGRPAGVGGRGVR